MITTVTLARNVSAEWNRLWTVRSTWVFTLVTSVGMLGIAALAGVSSGANAEPGGSPWRLAGIFGEFGMFGILVLATLAATADHATRGSVGSITLR